MQTRVFEYPNATVRVHMPELTSEEREKRMREIKLAAEMLLKGVMLNDTKRNDLTVH